VGRVWPRLWHRGRPLNFIVRPQPGRTVTIVFTFASPAFIVMANDSAVTKTFSDSPPEYSAGRKHFASDGVGVVTMWGARDGNRLVATLTDERILAETHTVESLAHRVQRYLIETYEPHDGPRDDTGYHVGGYMPDGTPRLFHIFWNAHGSGNAASNWGAYTFEIHTPPANVAGFLYNGRHDIVNAVIQPFIAELNRSGSSAFPMTPIGMCRLAHFVLRVGAELTPEVAPPFWIHVLSPKRRCISERADSLSPLGNDYFSSQVTSAGLSI